MGVVDLARDEAGKKVALKRLTLHGSAAEIARARQRLLREAEVLRKLHHPNIVRLLDVVDEGDEIVLVMPYMAAGSLAERVAQHGPAPAAAAQRQARRPTGPASSTGTSSRPTCSSTTGASRAWPTSAWPSAATTPTASPPPAWSWAPPGSWHPSRPGASR